MGEIATRLRRLVVERARDRCEYCGLSQVGQEARFHVDHVFPLMILAIREEESLRGRHPPAGRIDDSFIERWEPRYDKNWHDEEEYDRLVAQVAVDIQEYGTLSEQTFADIRKWKGSRGSWWIDWTNLNPYLDAVRKCRAAAENDRIHCLASVGLRGIGGPVASTFLHFLYPLAYPIIDVRTAAVLRFFGYSQDERTEPDRYRAFRSAVLAIQRSCPKWSLRQIDRAIMAYHKLVLEPLLGP